MKNAALALAIGVAALGATSTASATTCSADLLLLASGPRVAFGSTNVFDVSEVRVSDLSFTPLQTIPVVGGHFADALSSAVEPLDRIAVTFVTKTGSVVCMSVITVQAAGPRAPIVVGGGNLTPGSN